MKTILRPILVMLVCCAFIPSLKAQECNCADLFEKTIDTYEKNYSLFQFKVTEDNKELYRAHTDLMRFKAEQAGSPQDCKLVLEQWLTFFRDKHNYITLIAKDDSHTENIKLSKSSFKEAFNNNEYGQNPLLGIWQNGGYQVAVIPTPEKSEIQADFVGVVLESQNNRWNPQQVKFKLSVDFGTTYKAIYRMSDHSSEQLKAQQTSFEKLEFGSLDSWTKIWPQTDKKAALSEILRKFNEFHFTEVDGIPYLRFPDFYSVDATHVDSIMTANHQKLISSDFIIIDVRENKGGNDNVYAPILPYILDGPIEIPNSGLWMSDDNVQQFLNQSDLNGKSVEEFTEEERAMYDYVMSLKGTAFFQTEGYSTSYKPDTLFASPKKVILLATDAGSSGETFVYKAIQSKKVVFYGQNTMGVVDGFNGLSMDIGCFRLNYPSSFRARDVDVNPIDPYGIAPDVFVDGEIDVPQYAIEHMRQLIRLEEEKRTN